MAARSDPISPAETVQVLSYSASPTSSAISRGVRILLVIAVLPAIVAPFLPFTYDIGPVNVLYQVLKDLPLKWPVDTDMRVGMLALPFLLGIPIWLLQVRLLMVGQITRAEKNIAIGMGIICSIISLAFISSSFFDQGFTFASLSTEDWLIFGISPAIVLMGSVATVWLARRRVQLEIVAKGMLYTAYLANAGTCLVGFRASRDPGWYLTAAASFVMTVEFFWMALRRARPHSA